MEIMDDQDDQDDHLDMMVWIIEATQVDHQEVQSN